MNVLAHGGTISFIPLLALGMATLAFSKGTVARGIVIGSRQYLEHVARFVTSENLTLLVGREFGSSRDEVVAVLEYTANA